MKLSKLKISDILFRLSDDEITNIVFEKDNKFKKIKSTIGIVLGGPSMIPHRIDKVLELYNQGLIEKILVSGGIGFFNLDKKNPEARKLEEYLFQRGIQKKDIIVEEQSTDTFDNIYFSIQILSQYFELDEITITLITSEFHLKRTMGLITKVLNKNNIQGIGIKDGKHDIDNWNNSFRTKILIYKELIQLVRYAKKGYIEDMDIKVLKKQ